MKIGRYILKLEKLKKNVSVNSSRNFNFLSLAVLFLLLACNKIQKEESKIHKNEEIIRTFFSHFNKHDWTSMANMYTESAEFLDPSFGKKAIKQTRQEVVQKYTELEKIFPDLNDKIINIYPSSDEKHVTVEFISSGTAPDKSKLNLPICTVFTIENGLISKDFTYYDNSNQAK